MYYICLLRIPPSLTTSVSWCGYPFTSVCLYKYVKTNNDSFNYFVLVDKMLYDKISCKLSTASHLVDSWSHEQTGVPYLYTTLHQVMKIHHVCLCFALCIDKNNGNAKVSIIIWSDLVLIKDFPCSLAVSIETDGFNLIKLVFI